VRRLEAALEAALVEHACVDGKEVGGGRCSQSIRAPRLEETGHGHTMGVQISDGYRELAPPAGLRPVLACLWVRVVPAHNAAPVRVLPDACSDLIWRSGKGAFVAGPDTRPVVGPATPGAVLVGARFRPGAGGPALAQPLDELRDLRVDVADLLPTLARRLDPDLTPAAALRQLALAAGELAEARPPDTLVRAVARRLSDPRARSATVAEELGLSERQLLRRCLASVGYGPKTLQRVLRFRRFLRRLDEAGDDAELASLAADCGFADQAHLTRECSRLAGLSPGAIVRERVAEPVLSHANGDRAART
jgi:AraC-like DNA-binding protein